MIAATYLVTVTVPPGMSIEQCRHELRTSVRFGSPQVQFLHVTEYPDESMPGEQPDAVG